MARTKADIAETSEDLGHGQIVIITARWILILAGLLLTLWNPGPVSQVRIQVLVILALAVVNFFLHAQVLMRRPTLESAVYAASAADISVITLIIMTAGGFGSGSYIFYFPAVLVISVVFPTGTAILYTAAIITLYFLVAIGTAEPTQGDLQILATRLLMLAAVGVCGGMYRRIEAGRRQAAIEAQQALMAQIRARGASRSSSS